MSKIILICGTVLVAALIVAGAMYKTNSTIVALQSDKEFLMKHADAEVAAAKLDFATQCGQTNQYIFKSQEHKKFLIQCRIDAEPMR